MNDFLWFDDSHIYELLGLNEDGEEPCENEEETTDFLGFGDFETFCESFNGCCDCPFQHEHGRHCEELFAEAKEAANHE